MKKIIALLSVAIFATVVFAYAADELRPSQKLMQARAAWMTAINGNINAINFAAVAKDADALAAETKKVGTNLPNPLAKELTMAISSLAGELSVAASKQDGGAAKAKLGEIKGKCAECHAKIRDKK
jgi:hypothetical protein